MYSNTIETINEETHATMSDSENRRIYPAVGTVDEDRGLFTLAEDFYLWNEPLMARERVRVEFLPFARSGWSNPSEPVLTAGKTYLFLLHKTEYFLALCHDPAQGELNGRSPDDVRVIDRGFGIETFDMADIEARGFLRGKLSPNLGAGAYADFISLIISAPEDYLPRVISSAMWAAVADFAAELSDKDQSFDFCPYRLPFADQTQRILEAHYAALPKEKTLEDQFTEVMDKLDVMPKAEKESLFEQLRISAASSPDPTLAAKVERFASLVLA